MSFSIKFWGVRGSIACPSKDYVVFGGNTSCLEVNAEDQQIILDAGTGIRNLGDSNVRKGVNKSTILFSHTHWDHITGFPFFAPVYNPDNELKLMAGHLNEEGGLYKVLSEHMSNPVFPVPVEALLSNLSFTDFQVGQPFTLGNDILIETARLNHPGGATGYRIEFKGKAICYVTDTEHTPGKPDENVLELIEGADLVVYDSTYTEEEFIDKIGWGHSTWEEGARLVQKAGAKSLAIFHHAPEHFDTFMQSIEIEAKNRYPNIFVARENTTIKII